MSDRASVRNPRTAAVVLSAALLAIALLVSAPHAFAHDGPHLVPDSEEQGDRPASESGSDASTVNVANPQANTLSVANPQAAPNAACAGGPTIDGILLDECFVQNFTVDGDAKSITVWYTKNTTTAQRNVDGSMVTLRHWVSNDTQPQNIAQWGEEAWEAFYDVFGRHPYDKGCGDNINVQIEDGVGWAGIAYWASSGSCNIGIDAPMVRNGGGRGVVYHEFQHYQQYSFDDGCYSYLQANYPDDAEFVEGYADLAEDSVEATVDATGYGNTVAGYDPNSSLYLKSYNDVYNKYFIEQLGSLATPADPEHNMDAVYEHYVKCDDADTLYVLPSLIPSLVPGMTEAKLFMGFFAANWAKDWADPATQPELVYRDDDGNPYGSIPLNANVSMSGGSQNWSVTFSPGITDTWAGRYFQVNPQSGCDYVTLEVDGQAGANLGINLMAADTTGLTKVERSAWMGEDFSRTFPGNGVYDRLVAAVNTFDTAYDFDVTATCTTPVLDILEPRQVNPAWVGAPDSPISFLGRFKVLDGATPVRGLPESYFTAETEGDAISIVPGSLQEVGNEYWAVLVPPTKPAGTTLADLTVCTSGGICDTETGALLYVDPGNTDFGLVFDASGSMSTEDVAGEGQRVDNAKKAGYLMADLLRDGDRVLVMDFSAKDNPVGCGLPFGDGNCEMDVRTLKNRADVTSGNLATQIGSTKSAIDLISAREWTPIGEALDQAKDKLTASPAGLNPKHIVLLSDGEENVNPLYADIRSDLMASGVVVDTVGFSSEAPEPLLAQIAGDTGGTYRFVPTAPGSLNAVNAAQLDAEIQNQLAALGVPAYVAASLTTAPQPAQLGLANEYDFFETKGQQASRVLHVLRDGIAGGEWKTESRYVDDSVNVLRFVVVGKQPDYNLECGQPFRQVQILPPGADEGKGWIEVSPYGGTEWDVRNALYEDVIIINNPAKGIWKIRVLYSYYLCAQDAGQTDAIQAAVYNWFTNASVETDVRLEGRFLNPIVNNMGLAGDTVPIIGTLLNRTGTVRDAIVIGFVDKPGDTVGFLLKDDGAHMDGAANDGIYGAEYAPTDVGGSYNVRLLATWEDKTTGEWPVREWQGAFWIKGPELDPDNQDGDDIPTWYEERCKLDPTQDDSAGDLDRDGLSNGEEFKRGTLACDPDTDNGGERDGSEVDNNRDPLDPEDDFVSPIGHVAIRPLNGMIIVHIPDPTPFTGILIGLSTDPELPGKEVRVDPGQTISVTGLTNDQTLWVTVAGQNGNAAGTRSGPYVVTPKADPDPPAGDILIEDGALVARSKRVSLSISSTDTPLPGMAESANAHLGGKLSVQLNTVSGNVEMRISNSPDLADAEWEPLAFEKDWTLEGDGLVKRVYAQFRDGAGNVSMVVDDDILLIPYNVYLPMVLRSK